VDENGDLHLRITRQPNGKWVAAEINMNQSLGYGTYEWEVSSRYDQFAANVVGGLFTYLSPESVANQTGGVIGNGRPDTPHEIDIEFTGAWGNANLYHTTHDPDIQSPSKNYFQALAGDFTTHRFTWSPSSIAWGSYNGHVAGVENPAFPIVEQRVGPRNGEQAIHVYDGPVIPRNLNEIPIINFWIFDDNPSIDGPTDGQTQELIIHSFTYTPLEHSADFNSDSEVDGRDFLVWQRNVGTGNMPQHGDANYDSVVNTEDLAIWSAQYGGAMLQNAFLVPEPTGIISLLCFIGLSFRSW
jgi:hypothetical protein